MEERINQAVEFKDQNGFRRSLLQYVRHLSTHALESRLKEVFFGNLTFSKIFDLRCLQDHVFKIPYFNMSYNKSTFDRDQNLTPYAPE